MNIDERLARIEELLLALGERQTVRDWYTTEQVAQLVGKAEFTVREWLWLGRLNGAKRMSGRGAHASGECKGVVIHATPEVNG